MAEKPFDLAIVGAGQAGCTLAGKIAEKGVKPSTGEPLRIAVLDQGPYFRGKPNPGYGAPERRRMFTNIFLDFAGKYTRWTEVDGLFICDGSVMPRAASQGYGASVASLALLASSRIVERHFSRG